MNSAGTATAGPRLQERRFASRAELHEALAGRLQQAIMESSGPASGVMLTGGSTPIPAYRTLATRVIEPAPGLHVLFSDERHVPSSSDASNYHQARPLLDRLALPEERILRVRTELTLEQAAHEYERRLEELLAEGARLSLGLLGLGADGHIASLFSRQDLERAEGRLAIAVQRPDGMGGISVTPAVLARFEKPLFVVTESEKTSALAALLRGDPDLIAWRAVAKCAEVEVWWAR